MKYSFKVGFIFLADAISPIWHVVNIFTGVVKKLCNCVIHDCPVAALIVQQVAQVTLVV